MAKFNKAAMLERLKTKLEANVQQHEELVREWESAVALWRVNVVAKFAAYVEVYDSTQGWSHFYPSKLCTRDIEMAIQQLEMMDGDVVELRSKDNVWDLL